MPDPIFISEATVYYVHDRALDEHGGLIGVYGDRPSLIAYVPQSRWQYEDPTPSIPRIGAYYAAAAVKIHAFVDGNKRVALVLMELFLLKNGYELIADDDDVVEKIEDYARNAIGEEDFVVWVEESCYQHNWA